MLAETAASLTNESPKWGQMTEKPQVPKADTFESDSEAPWAGPSPIHITSPLPFKPPFLCPRGTQGTSVQETTHGEKGGQSAERAGWLQGGRAGLTAHSCPHLFP